MPLITLLAVFNSGVASAQVSVVSDDVLTDEAIALETQTQDYVADRDQPSPEDEIKQFALEHPETVAEYELQTTTTPVQSLGNPEAPASIGESRSACERVWPTRFSVCGAIKAKYKEIGGALSWLGPPTSGEVRNPDQVGYRSTFLGGAIYWHPETGAHAITNDGMRQWGSLGWEQGVLGYPTSGPKNISPLPVAQYQNFQGGDTYYSPVTGGAIWGDLKQRYDAIGGPSHPIGIPVSNELSNTDEYRFNNFSNGVMTWQRSSRRSHYMYLPARRVWESLGRETGTLGFPETDEVAEHAGVFHLVNFGNRGVIAWNNLLGARELQGQLFNLWIQHRGTPNDLGWPIPSLESMHDSIHQDFTKGTVLGSSDSLAWIPSDEEYWPNEIATRTAGLTMDADSHISPGMSRSANLCSSLPPVSEQKKNENFAVKIGAVIKGKTNSRDYPDEFRFMIRKGFYDASMMDGWGQLKALCKHNFSNYKMMEAVSKHSPIGYSSDPDKDYFRFDKIVYFYSCGGPSFTRNNCKQVYDPEEITVIFDPFKPKNYTGTTAKWANGLITAWCNPAGIRRSEPYVSRCPDHVNQWKRLGHLL